MHGAGECAHERVPSASATFRKRCRETNEGSTTYGIPVGLDRAFIRSLRLNVGEDHLAPEESAGDVSHDLFDLDLRLGIEILPFFKRAAALGAPPKMPEGVIESLVEGVHRAQRLLAITVQPNGASKESHERSTTPRRLR